LVIYKDYTEMHGQQNTVSQSMPLMYKKYVSSWTSCFQEQ